MKIENIPVQDFDEETLKRYGEIVQTFQGKCSETLIFPRSFFGKQKYVYPSTFKDHYMKIRNLEIRTDDIWVTTFPRSGTMWMRELSWLIKNDLDFEKAKRELILHRVKFLEKTFIFPEEKFPHHEFDDIISTKPYRHIFSHLPLSMLPRDVLNSKVIHVARDPRDVAVSFYHMSKLMGGNTLQCDYDFRTYWKLFMDGKHIYTPMIEVVKEAWEQKDHPNMLFVFYEDMKKDLPSVLRRVAAFLGKQYSEEQLELLHKHLLFDNMKKNQSVVPDEIFKNPELVKVDAGEVIRKGIIGDWKNYFDAEMELEAEKWMADSLMDTDLRFPE